MRIRMERSDGFEMASHRPVRPGVQTVLSFAMSSVMLQLEIELNLLAVFCFGRLRLDFCPCVDRRLITTSIGNFSRFLLANG